MFTSQAYGYQAQPYGNIGNGLNPQTFDLGSIVNTVAQGVAQTLPNLIANLLSAHPQIQQITRQGTLTGAFNPQNQYGGGLNAFSNRQQFAPFGAQPDLQSYGALSPQGFDFGNLVNTIAQGAAQILPSLLISLLSTQPQFQQLARQGGYAGGINPQSLYGGGLNMFENRPQFNWQQGGGVVPQNFDFGSMVSTIAQSAAQVLPGLLVNVLSTNPQIQQLARQSRGATTGYGTNQWGAAGLTPQGFDVGAIAQNIASIISPQIPGIVGGVMGQTFGYQPTTVH
jgi:hypothetical protein